MGVNKLHCSPSPQFMIHVDTKFYRNLLSVSKCPIAAESHNWTVNHAALKFLPSKFVSMFNPIWFGMPTDVQLSWYQSWSSIRLNQLTWCYQWFIAFRCTFHSFLSVNELKRFEEPPSQTFPSALTEEKLRSLALFRLSPRGLCESQFYVGCNKTKLGRR